MSNKTNKPSKASFFATLEGAVRSFVSGAIGPSRAGFFGMLAGIAVMFAVICWFFNYDTLSGPNGAYVSRSSADSDGAATFRALQVGRSGETRPLLIILGSSITASAFASEQLLQTELSQTTGMAWQVAMLTTALQSPVDQINLIQTALGSEPHNRSHVLILLGADVIHTGWNNEQILEVENEPRLGIRSDWADAEIALLGGTPRPRSDFFLAENTRFFTVNGAAALLRLMVRRAAPRKFDFYAPAGFLPDADRKSQLIADQMRASLALKGSGFLPVIQRLNNKLEQQGVAELILMQEHPSPALLEQQKLSEAVEAEMSTYEQFAEENGLKFWPIFQDLPLSEAHYSDDLHIGDADIQAKFRAALVDNVSDLIGKIEQ